MFVGSVFSVLYSHYPFFLSHSSFHHATGGLFFILMEVLAIVYFPLLVVCFLLRNYMPSLLILCFILCLFLSLCSISVVVWWSYPFHPLGWLGRYQYLLDCIPFFKSFLELLICLQVLNQLLICSYHLLFSMFLIYDLSTKGWTYLLFILTSFLSCLNFAFP